MVKFINGLRGESQIENVTKSGKSPKGGGGVSEKSKKSKNLNLDFLIREGGVRIFKFFPNVNVDYFETVNASVEQKIS